jgi:hypothetical protein
MSLTKLPLGGNNLFMTSLFPPRESLVVTSGLGTGNSRTFFYGVGIKAPSFPFSLCLSEHSPRCVVWNLVLPIYVRIQYTHRQEVSWELPASASSASALLLLLGPVYLFRRRIHPSFSDTLYRRSLKHVNIHNGMWVVKDTTI